MNLFKAVILLVNCCNCLVFPRDCMSNTTCTFFGLASIPRRDTMKPRNFPKDSKSTFGRVKYHTVFPQCPEHLCQVEDMPSRLYALYQHVVHVYLHVSSNLLPEHLIQKTLIGCSSVLQFERHDLIAIQSPVGDEDCLLLVHLIHAYLIIA
jgi:hypothetical protein